MKRILCTGGFGFIGGWLIQQLLDEGHCVHVVDDLSTSPVPLHLLLGEINRQDELTYTIGTIEQWMREGDTEFDEIYHLASPVGPAGILPHAGKMVQQVVGDTYRMIEIALHSGARLLDVSTSEVYGGGANGLCSETMPRIIQAETTVRLEYAVAKLAAETAILNTCKVNSLHAVIVRPFNVAGPRQSPKGGFVLPRFVEQAMNNQPLTVFGTGQQIRAFTHVKDIAEGLVCALRYGESGAVYNLGNPENKTSILDLAHQVIEIVGGGEVSFVDPRTIYGDLYAEAADKYPDVSLAIQELGWTPTRSIRETILDVYEYVSMVRAIL